MTGDNGHCMRPCTDVDYSVGKDMFDFSLTDPEEVAKVGGCDPVEGVISIQFDRRFQYETVRIVLHIYAKIISEENIYRFTPGGPHHPAGGPAVRVRGRGGAVAGLVRHDAPGAPRHHRRGSY